MDSPTTAIAAAAAATADDDDGGDDYEAVVWENIIRRLIREQHSRRHSRGRGGG